MPADERTTAPPSLRQRRRAAATREILDAAERHITEHGPAALSLRAIARSLGMTVQALYHYFPSREALVTELITKTYDDLADAVQAAIDTAADYPGLPRLVVATEGYRRWAIAHPERFQLLYGTPLRDYAAPVEGPTTQATRRMSAIFERELFGGFTTAQLAAADTPALSSSLRALLEQVRGEDPDALPPPADALLLSAWGHMHGLVVLEVFGHTSFIGDHQAEIFRMAMLRLLEDIHSRIPASVDTPRSADT
ncbi:TetR/AcrR family transcriptional regulator [Streptomyces sp. NEAU-YJ-81]|uniref:TetR/AcrR family transcriptional regulator n=1 Tax=Streptomyces sp. NEAU-YJ-81 TaxID=2820288 RepID=UPI001ABCBA11|nr:TetR/AcrR family transcriptional regulator [Streptomyces sp. NEAU-YJ-81]MBO3676278.1 TetR/AcrR family transcriptional regulator [Streptomyces sp. NEAU-YJ-81]